jgi:hypothetical protein
MTEPLRVEQCPETGICSLYRPDGRKLDLMPDEADGVRQCGGDPAEIRKRLAEVDPAFADSIRPEDLDALSRLL